jgi:hypothetical protein
MTEKELEFFDKVFQDSIGDVLFDALPRQEYPTDDLKQQVVQDALELAEIAVKKRRAFLELMEKEDANQNPAPA